MIKSIHTLLFIVITTLPTIYSQTIEFPNGKFPFTQTVEWSGRGSLFYASDPSGKTEEINICLLNQTGVIDWTRSVYPKAKGTHLILSGMADYFYFVDDFVPVNNAIRYNQVNISGSVTPTKVDLLNVISSYKYRNIVDLVLKDVISTPKSLVFYFQLTTPDKTAIENIFVSITHHNNRVYHCKGPVSHSDLISQGKEDAFVFSGAFEDAISFSRFAGGAVEFFSFSSKAEPLVGHTYKITGADAISSKIHFVSLNGSAYIEKEMKRIATAYGKGIFVNGYFYYVMNDAKDRCLKIFRRDDKGNLVQINTCENPAKSAKKYSGDITFISLGEKLIVIGDIDKSVSAFEILNDKVTSIDAAKVNKDIIQRNPSSFYVGNNSSRFIHYINGAPYYVDPSDLTQAIISLKKLDK
ncbi:MAG: hypothetical protein H3C31_10085 [Brumimicrobium sp.]|nr:hypothetical protein [Brumimicrobium sp.]